MLRRAMSRIGCKKFVRNRRAGSRETRDEDGPVYIFLCDLWMTLPFLSELKTNRECVNQVASNQKRAHCVERLLFVERVDEDPEGFPEAFVPEIIEAYFLAGLCGERIGIERDPSRVTGLVECCDPGGARSGLPDRHGFILSVSAQAFEMGLWV